MEVRTRLDAPALSGGRGVDRRGVAQGTCVGVVAGFATTAVVPGEGDTGTGVPSTPRTRPAGMRRGGIGVVSGVGGGGSGAWRSVACSAR